jgi:hypothetical protein
MLPPNLDNIHLTSGVTNAPITPKVIVPTIGRQVWYWQNGLKRQRSLADPSQQPEAATVVFVHNDRCVNLQVLDDLGHAHRFTSIQLVQPDDRWTADTGPHCQCMPFQVGQAAKG